MKYGDYSLIVSILLLQLTATAQLYEDATANLPLPATQSQSMDVRAADIDGDGDLDLILANEFQANILLQNNGAGVFTDVTAGNLPARIQDSEDVAIADFDKDGDLDLVFCSEDDAGPPFNETNVHEYYLNNGNGRFTTAGYSLPDSRANALITADINGDQYPDLLFGNAGLNSILINDSTGAFIDESLLRLPSLNKVTQDLALGDIDGDGDDDLFVGNEDGNQLLINDGNGVFQDESLQRLPQGLNIETRKIALGDIDNDGDLDVFLSNVQFIPGRTRQNRLFVNNGAGFFSDVTVTALPVDNEDTLDGIFVDVEEDGDLDIILTNVRLSFVGKTEVYLNNGEGQYDKLSDQILDKVYASNGLGVIAEDFNGDGRKDLYVCDRNTGGSSRDFLLFKNSILPTSAPINPAKDIQLYPNPTNQQFDVVIQSSDEPLSFELLDSNGITLGPLYPIAQTANRYSFDISAFSSHTTLLLLHIKLGEHSFFRRIIVTSSK